MPRGRMILSGTGPQFEFGVKIRRGGRTNPVEIKSLFFRWAPGNFDFNQIPRHPECSERHGRRRRGRGGLRRALLQSEMRSEPFSLSLSPPAERESRFEKTREDFRAHPEIAATCPSSGDEFCPPRTSALARPATLNS